MKEELDKKLCEKYPKIFRDRHAPMTTTAMCWGFDHGDGWYDLIDKLCAIIDNQLNHNLRQLECVEKYKEYQKLASADDWSFLNDLYSEEWLSKDNNLEKIKTQYLEKELPEWFQNVKEIPQVVASQVKEKYGTLRFYYDGGDEFIEGAVAMAELMSSRICEVCGNSGKTVGGGWIRTLCKTHAEEFSYDWKEDNQDVNF